MVHALREVESVLRPQGVLIDLRPAPIQRRISLVRSGRHASLGTTCDNLADDFAADRAVAAVIRGGVFEPVRTSRFVCRRVYDSVEELSEWFTDSGPHQRLLRRLRRRAATSPPGAKVVLSVPMVIRVLRKPRA
jgi:hypothetical protein